MNPLRSPFKFLDPFTLADRDEFFGRDREVVELYRLVFKTPLLLVYGLSGTGKTSLIQCGLASRFDGPDWLPLWVRRQGDINRSLDLTIKRALPNAEYGMRNTEYGMGLPLNTAGKEEGTVPDKIQSLYQHYLRPVFLIFDQFEELFIFGTKEEKDDFVATLKSVLEAELPCTVLIAIREEYLGQLYPFEREIPSLFDFRMRVEPMDAANVRTVLEESFRKFNISVEPPAADRYAEIIANVSRSRSGIELPYLQVYLDMLYREDFARTYPQIQNPKSKIPNPQWLPLQFTRQEIQDFGTIDSVLDKFLTEQQQGILDELQKRHPALPNDAVRLVADAFVSDEGTKRPIRFHRSGGLLQLEASAKAYFPPLPADALTECLEKMEAARLIRSDDDSMELAHDSLAALIDSRRTDEQRQRNEIKRQIRSSFHNFPSTKEFLTRKQLNVFEDVLPELNLEEELVQFVRESGRFRTAEESELLRKERRRRNWATAAALLGAGLATLAGWQYFEADKAKKDAVEKQAAAERSDSLAQVAKADAIEKQTLAQRSDSLAQLARDSAFFQKNIAERKTKEAETSLAEMKKAQAEKLAAEIDRYIASAKRMAQLKDFDMANRILDEAARLAKDHPVLLKKIKENR